MSGVEKRYQRARNLGSGKIYATSGLGRWCRKGNGETAVNSGTGERVSSQDYERMRRELAKVKVERDI